MARLPRLTVPGHPHHVIQQGHNRQPIFASAADCDLLLALLHECAHQHGVSVHAYVLVQTHFQLLATPQANDSLARTMQALGRRYVRHFNQQQGRSGTLWGGRYRSTLIEADRYLLPCMAYLDLAPVREGVTADPAAYPWSSYGHYVGQRQDRIVTPHPSYWRLGNTPFARDAAYAAMVQAGLDKNLEQKIARHVMAGWALGDDRFIAALETATGRRARMMKAGRPTRSVIRPQ